MKQFKIFLIGLFLLAAGSLCTCYFSGESASNDKGGNNGENPGGTPTVSVEITGAITKSLTVPIINTNYNNECDLWIGNDINSGFEVRFKWSGTPELNKSYTYGSGIDQKVIVINGDRRWEYWLSYTVTLTSINPLSGTITGVAEEQDAYCCDKPKGESNPVNIAITFSGI